MKKIYITGVSGTGKTTIAKELNKRGFYTISIDEVPNLCSWINKSTGEKNNDKDIKLTPEFTNTNEWFCDTTQLNKLLNKEGDIVFVLGMADNQDNFINTFDKIFILECSPETFCKRINQRADNDFGKDKKIQEQISNNYKTYTEKMLAKGAILVNTEKTINEVVEEIIKQTT